MADMPQAEVQDLIAMEKIRINDDRWIYPGLGGDLSIPLVSKENREEFIIDINRSNIKLSKVTYTNRARVSIMLIRLDIDGPPHRNPNGEELLCPHLHIYREGYADKWAIGVPPEFTNLSDLWVALQDFLSYCNVTEPPLIERGLFL